MANLEHVKVARRGATAIEDWRAKNPGTALDLDFDEHYGGADLNDRQGFWNKQSLTA